VYTSTQEVLVFSEMDEREGTLAQVVLEPIVLVAQDARLVTCARLLDDGIGALIVASEPLRTVTARDVVRAVATGARLSAIGDVELSAPVIFPVSMPIDAAVRHLLESPDRCVIVQAADGKLLGRLTLRHALRALLPRPAWVRALQLALHIETTSTTELYP
jgi:CBS domain